MDGAIALEKSGVEPGLESRFRALVDSHRDRALTQLDGPVQHAIGPVTQRSGLANQGAARFNERKARHPLAEQRPHTVEISLLPLP